MAGLGMKAGGLRMSLLSIVENDLRTLLCVISGSGRVSPSLKRMVTLELSSVCTLRCPLCPTGSGLTKRASKFMPLPTFHKILALTKEHAQGYVLGMWGEPMLYPQLEEALAATAPLPTWTSTNLNFREDTARLLASQEHMHVICAIDTLSPEDYPLYRVQGDYGLAMRNIETMSRGRCTIYPQFLISPDVTDVAPYKDFASRLGIPASNVILKIKRGNFTLSGEGRTRLGRCHAPYNGLYFDCDGFLRPCCNDVGEDLHILNVNSHDSYEGLLNAPTVRQARIKLAQDKNNYTSCRRCRGETFWNVRLPYYSKRLASLIGSRSGSGGEPQRMPFEE